jgi:hypothetical protein
MRNATKAAAFMLAAAAIAAYIVAMVNMMTPEGETWSDIGNGTMISACFLSLWALHISPRGATGSSD